MDGEPSRLLAWHWLPVSCLIIIIIITIIIIIIIIIIITIIIIIIIIIINNNNNTVAKNGMESTGLKWNETKCAVIHVTGGDKSSKEAEI